MSNDCFVFNITILCSVKNPSSTTSALDKRINFATRTCPWCSDCGCPTTTATTPVTQAPITHPGYEISSTPQVCLY